MRTRITNVVLAYALWLLLTWSLEPETLVAGAVVAVAVGLMVGEILQIPPGMFFNPRRWFWGLVYVPYFALECARANLDMAYRVLHPAMPIRPGVVRIHTTLKSDVARAFLATSITLMPGTHVVDIVDDRVYVHWINVRGSGEDDHTRRIVRGFESLLRKVFE